MPTIQQVTPAKQPYLRLQKGEIGSQAPNPEDHCSCKIIQRLRVAQYRGNVGNLLQHWVLCEILNAGRNHAQELAFIDAYSMAPFATERPKPDRGARVFNSVRDRLPGEHTPYEQAWHELAQGKGDGYPISAALVKSLWPGRYSLLLCDTDPSTAQELTLWSNETKRSPKCIAAEVYPGDWRARFNQGVAASGDLVFFSFDPDMFNQHRVRDRNSRHMYPGDLDLLATVVHGISQGMIVQLSTYSANCDNSQSTVIEVVASLIRNSGLKIVAAVSANGQMMSLVLARGIVWSDSMRCLASRFASWQALAEQRQTF